MGTAVGRRSRRASAKGEQPGRAHVGARRAAPGRSGSDSGALNCRRCAGVRRVVCKGIRCRPGAGPVGPSVHAPQLCQAWGAGPLGHRPRSGRFFRTVAVCASGNPYRGRRRRRQRRRWGRRAGRRFRQPRARRWGVPVDPSPWQRDACWPRRMAGPVGRQGGRNHGTLARSVCRRPPRRPLDARGAAALRGRHSENSAGVLGAHHVPSAPGGPRPASGGGASCPGSGALPRVLRAQCGVGVQRVQRLHSVLSSVLDVRACH